MTKILVFSDSHGEFNDMRYVIDRVHNDAEYVLHLGDGSADLERLRDFFPRQAFVGVSGNCDWGISSNYTGIHRTLDMHGVRIFMCHGHRHDVVCGDYTVLSAAANSVQADIALFGHTHYSEYLVALKPGKTDINEKGAALHILNPGSITRPRGGVIKGKSYAVIELDGNGGINIKILPF